MYNRLHCCRHVPTWPIPRERLMHKRYVATIVTCVPWLNRSCTQIYAFLWREPDRCLCIIHPKCKDLVSLPGFNACPFSNKADRRVLEDCSVGKLHLRVDVQPSILFRPIVGKGVSRVPGSSLRRSTTQLTESSLASRAGLCPTAPPSRSARNSHKKRT